MYMIGHFSRSNLVRHEAVNCESDKEITFTKRYVYLIQTESCIPENLADKDVFGDPLACNCDVIVLGFKEKCKDTSRYGSHIKHIFNSTTTWTTGRELLYNTSLLSGKKYMYYLFMDDDVNMEMLGDYTDRNAWRAFEDFLYRLRPPIAASDTTEWRFVDRVLRFRNNHGCPGGRHLEPLEEYIPALFYDAMFNAFHHEAIKNVLEPILPYWSKFDNVSWWYPQSYVCFMAELVYKHHTVFPTELVGRNPVHKSYPKSLEDKWIIDTIIADIEKIVPKDLRGKASTLIKGWKTQSAEYKLRQRGYHSFCDFPSPQPSCVQPYKHLL